MKRRTLCLSIVAATAVAGALCCTLYLVRQCYLRKRGLEMLTELLPNQRAAEPEWPYSWIGCKRATSWLSLDRTVDDDELGQAVAIVPLEGLVAWETGIGDSVLAQLDPSQLKSLWLDKTRVTDDGCAILRVIPGSSSCC